MISRGAAIRNVTSDLNTAPQRGRRGLSIGRPMMASLALRYVCFAQVRRLGGVAPHPSPSLLDLQLRSAKKWRGSINPKRWHQA
jgi:hypothetical protein